MPDGNKNGYTTGKGIRCDDGKGNFLYRENVEDFDEEATAEAMRRACCFNFNNFIHSAQLMAKAMEASSTDVDEAGIRRSVCNSGDSDLMVLSVVLNKKQKENDEVALAIERLRQNGVNCVIFTMSDIRNGNTKGGSTCECFRVSSSPALPKNDTIKHSSCSCATRDVKTQEKSLQPTPVSTPTTPQIEPPRNLVINISPTPSPSPPPEPPASPEANLFLPDQELISDPNKDVTTSLTPTAVQFQTLAKKKHRRKRRYPYSIRKPVRPKKPKLMNNCLTNCTSVESASSSSNIPVELVENSEETQKVADETEMNASIEERPPKIPKRRGRKSQVEKFEEAFQNAVESFVETTKEMRRKTRGSFSSIRSMYTRSSSNSTEGVLDYVDLPAICKKKLSDASPKGIPDKKHKQTKTNRRNRRKKEKSTNGIKNVKAICIRNIFMGPTILEKTVGAKDEHLEETQDEAIEVITKGKEADEPKPGTPKNHGNVKMITEAHDTLSNEDGQFVRTNGGGVISMVNGFQNDKIPVGISEPLESEKTAISPKTSNGDVGKRRKVKTKLEKAKERRTLKVSERAHRSNKMSVKGTDTSAIVEEQTNVNGIRKTSATQPLPADLESNFDRIKRRAFSPDIIFRGKRKKTRVATSSSEHALRKGDKLNASKSVVSFDDIRRNSRRQPVTNIESISSTDTLEELDDTMKEVKETLDAMISAVIIGSDKELTLRESKAGEWDDMPDIRKQCDDNLCIDRSKENSEPPVLIVQVDVKPEAGTSQEMPSLEVPCTDDSLPDNPDSMQLRRSSFYSLVTGNVRTNLENYLDGRVQLGKSSKKRKKVKNGFLLHHGDNCPEQPESPYKLHLATQVLLKLNRRRSKTKPKEERTKNLLSYLKLMSKRPIRSSKNQTKVSEEVKIDTTEESVFSGEWGLTKKYICGVCGQTENYFWDMVTHKGEEHPGVVVTHVELPPNQETPPSLIKKAPIITSASSHAPTCSKCSASFNSMGDLHSHIFECAGNVSWLVEKTPVKRKTRRRGFKRRFSSTPKKSKRVEATKRRSTDLHKCIYCSREFKTEGWLKNHMTSHSLPVSIPLDKLPLAPLPVRACVKKSTCPHQLRNSSVPLIS